MVDASFQDRVQPWMMACFGPEISADRVERGDRLLEEVFELLQASGYDPARILSLRDYVWGRKAGDPAQEAGGVMVTLAAFCLAHDLDMHASGEAELARIWTKVEKIRAKQAAKPKHSPLPVADRPHVSIVHDGFSGDVIGHYTTREGKRGVVVQQDGTRVVHVYGEKWLAKAEQVEEETITIHGRAYRKFIRRGEPVDDGTLRCIACGQIDEHPWHDESLCPAMAENNCHPYEDFNSAINFAVDVARIESETFLRSWREGDWTTLDNEWPEWKEFVSKGGSIHG